MWVRRVGRWSAGLAAIAVLALAVACGSEGTPDSSPPTQPPSMTPTVPTEPTSTVPTATPTRVASPAPGPTGIAGLDTTLLLMATRDAERIFPRVIFSEVACETNPTGAGAPPRCEPGEAQGTKVKVMPWSSCEGQHARAAQAKDLVASHIAQLNLSPVAVVPIEGKTQLGYQPGDKYGIVFASLTAGAPAVMFATDTEGRITRIYRGCAALADELIERAGGPGVVIFPKQR